MREAISCASRWGVIEIGTGYPLGVLLPPLPPPPPIHNMMSGCGDGTGMTKEHRAKQVGYATSP